MKPWDDLKGYPMIHGRMRVSATAFANFNGNFCGDEEAAIANHAKAPDAHHPHYFAGTEVYNVVPEALIKLYGPSPKWRNPRSVALFRRKRPQPQWKYGFDSHTQVFV